MGIDDFVRFRAPGGTSIDLGLAPRLASWDAKTSRSQIALGEYLDHISEVTREPLAMETNAGLALELLVALPPSVDIASGGYDLDNFLYPVAQRLGAGRFASVWGSKGRGARSIIRIGRAVPESGESDGWRFATATTDVSTATVAWKRQIAGQVADALRAPDGPVEMHISFILSSRRNWAWLWKPAIDALGPILGVDDPMRPFHTRDDRIVRLGLHRTIDDTLRNRVRLGIWWREIESNDHLESTE